MGKFRFFKSIITNIAALTCAGAAAAPGFTSVDYAADFQSLDYVDFAEAIRPPGACSFQTARTSCANNVSTVDWDGCSVGEATLSGGWNEEWSPGFCVDGARPGRLIKGASVTRTSNGETLTQPSNMKIVTKTTAHSAYDGSFISGNGVQVTSNGKVRTVVIHGIQRTIMNASERVWFDQSITSTGLTVSGTRAAGNRTVSGELTSIHNLSLYRAVHSFDAVRWGNPNCCYPTGGRVSTQLAGQREGDVAMSFTSQCGRAHYTDADKLVSTVTLPECSE